jgi:hypothetical protein
MMAQATLHARTRSRARVIVIQQPMKRVGSEERPAFDFGPAERYGQVEILATNGKHIFKPDIFRAELDERLVDFNPDRDYIIAAGDYTVLFFVGMILGEKFPSVRILQWVPSSKAYQPITLTVR